MIEFNKYLSVGFLFRINPIDFVYNINNQIKSQNLARKIYQNHQGVVFYDIRRISIGINRCGNVK